MAGIFYQLLAAQTCIFIALFSSQRLREYYYGTSILDAAKISIIFYCRFKLIKNFYYNIPHYFIILLFIRLQKLQYSSWLMMPLA